MIPAILAAIRTQLKASITGVTIDNFPANPADYDKIPWQRGFVLVAYKGRQFGEPKTTGLYVQEATAQIEVYVGRKSLKDDSASVALLEAVRFALTGFRPAGASKLYPVSDSFVDEKDAVWIYAITFACLYDAREVDTSTADPAAAKFTFIDDTLNETTEITPDAQPNPITG